MKIVNMNVWIQFISSHLDTELYFMLIGAKNKPTCDVYDMFTICFTNPVI